MAETAWSGMSTLPPVHTRIRPCSSIARRCATVEFWLEVFKVGIIEAELALQSAIGNTATVAEQLNDLIDDL